MRSELKSDPGHASRWLPVAFPIIALLGLLLLVLLQPEPVDGTVLSVRQGSEGVDYATVEFTNPDSGETAVEVVALPTEYVGEEKVPLWPGNDWAPPQVGLFGQVDPTPTLIIAIGAIATLLGFVVQLTVRGFGYVRGTAKPGQTNPTEVAEDRGFYWRT